MDKLKKINESDYLKLIGMLTMLLDHAAIAFLVYGSIPYLIFRAIGRLAFPIFAFYIVMGYKRTKSVKHYMIRLGLFAAISQVPFSAFMGGLTHLNVMVTFFLSIIMLHLYEKKNLLWVLLLLIADFIGADYGAYGLLMILIIYQYYESPKMIVMLILGLTSVMVALSFMQQSSMDLMMMAQLLSVIGVVIMYIPTPYMRINRWISYGFYPGHLMLLTMIRYLI